eukprot:ANDGO_00072.mRNA.1 Cystatin-A3
MKVGGTTAARAPVSEDHELVGKIRADLEAPRDSKFSHFECLSVASQVVAGINYFFKILIDAEKGECVHVRVYKDLQGNVKIAGIQEHKSREDELKYF